MQNGHITKSGVLPSNYFVFLNILFQFKNLLKRVDLMYKQPKCPYSYCLVKVHQCRFKNLAICLCSYVNNTLKILLSESYKISSYFPVEFVNLFKIRLIFIAFYCFRMFLNKPFTYLTCAYLKTCRKRCFNGKSLTYIMWRWIYWWIFKSALVYL